MFQYIILYDYTYWNFCAWMCSENDVLCDRKKGKITYRICRCFFFSILFIFFFFVICYINVLNVYACYQSATVVLCGVKCASIFMHILIYYFVISRFWPEKNNWVTKIEGSRIQYDSNTYYHFCWNILFI